MANIYDALAQVAATPRAQPPEGTGGDREASRAGLGGAPRVVWPEGFGEEAPRDRPRAGDVCPGGGHWAGARPGRRRRGPGAAFLPEPGVDSLQPTGPGRAAARVARGARSPVAGRGGRARRRLEVAGGRRRV